jgi:hypothetical protein
MNQRRPLKAGGSALNYSPMLAPSQLFFATLGDRCPTRSQDRLPTHGSITWGKTLHGSVRIFLMLSLWKSCMKNRKFLISRPMPHRDCNSREISRFEGNQEEAQAGPGSLRCHERTVSHNGTVGGSHGLTCRRNSRPPMGGRGFRFFTDAREPQVLSRTVDKLSQLVTNGDEFEQIAEGLPVLTQQIQ